MLVWQKISTWWKNFLWFCLSIQAEIKQINAVQVYLLKADRSDQISDNASLSRFAPSPQVRTVPFSIPSSWQLLYCKDDYCEQIVPSSLRRVLLTVWLTGGSWMHWEVHHCRLLQTRRSCFRWLSGWLAAGHLYTASLTKPDTFIYRVKSEDHIGWHQKIKDQR